MGGWYGLWYSGWYGGHVIHGVHSSREAGREGLPTNSKTVLATKSFFSFNAFFSYLLFCDQGCWASKRLELTVGTTNPDDSIHSAVYSSIVCRLHVVRDPWYYGKGWGVQGRERERRELCLPSRVVRDPWFYGNHVINAQRRAPISPPSRSPFGSCPEVTLLMDSLSISISLSLPSVINVMLVHGMISTACLSCLTFPDLSQRIDAIFQLVTAAIAHKFVASQNLPRLPQ